MKKQLEETEQIIKSKEEDEKKRGTMSAAAPVPDPQIGELQARIGRWATVDRISVIPFNLAAVDIVHH